MILRFGGLALLLAAAAPLQSQPAGFELERQELKAEIKPGATLHVDNEFGDVRARFGGHQGPAEIRAVIQHLDGEGPRLLLESAATPGGWQVKVGYRDAPEGPLRTSAVAGQRKRADLVLFVPAGVHLRASALDGTLEARGLQGNLEGRTRHGEVSVRGIRGDLRLETVGGNLLVAPESIDRTRQQHLKTATGLLELYLRENGHFRIAGRTGGTVSTDYSLKVSREGVAKEIEATVGKGTTPIQVELATGRLRLVRKPSADLARREDEP